MNTTDLDNPRSGSDANPGPRLPGAIRRTGLRLTSRLLLATAVAAAAALWVTGPAGATPTASYQGPATLYNNSAGQADSGGSQDQFTIQLPAQAACPGDTTTGGYLVDTYLVPQSTAISSLTFSGGIPSTGYALYDSLSHKAWSAENTATGSGQIIGIDNNFEFDGSAQVGHSRPSLTSLLAGSGVWEVGIACDLGGAITNYWNTEVTFTASSSDPGGFVWSDTPGAATPEVPYAIALPVLAIGIGAAAVVLRRRHLRRTEQFQTTAS